MSTPATLNLTSGDPATTPADALVVATTHVGSFSVVPGAMTKATVSKIQAALLSVGATGNADELVRIPGAGLCDAPVIVAVGLGNNKGAIKNERLRRAAGSAIRSLAGFKKVSIAIPASNASQVGAILEGAGLGAYTFTDHLFSKKPNSKVPVRSITLFTVLALDSESKKQLTRARHVVSNVHFARDAINTSPLHLPPAELAARAKSHLAETSVKVTVLDERALTSQGYGGIMGVGQGSSRGPRLIRMEYKPRGAQHHVALIGKGITFDTGGISLKPPAGMHAMKGDMSGAAAVIATMRAIADLKLPIAVTAYAACAENMPGGAAQRPGDVITIYGGKTVEVLNTDAEGRLVMADVLVRVAQDNADVVLDISTLTGAAVVALGHRTAGVMGDAHIRDAVHAAADRAGEEFWPMPMPEELRPLLESNVADIANISQRGGVGQREGGMLSAAWFLKEFVPEGLPWAHLDIAGPAFHEHAAYGYTHKGGVGFGVRTLLTFVEDVLAGSVSLQSK
ncbi:MAG: leucyl aminopeptidase [Actinomycetes bacterium]